MDKLIYVAMTGAKHLMLRQENIAHNLANADTPGFRAELSAFRSAPAIGDGLPTRAFAVDSTIGADFAPGPIKQTGRPLDVAIQGAGWLAVQAPDGTEAYTRNGSFVTDANGVLQTAGGLSVLSDAGPITIPPDHTVSIADDGTVSATPLGQGANAAVTVGRIKLVNPPEQDLTRSEDGLFRLKDGEPAPTDENVRVAGGAIEGSNVNATEALVSMIALAREYDLQMRMLQTADGNARQASQLLSVTG